MPTYVYHCDQCNSEFEAVRKFSDAPLNECPEGHEGVKRVFTPAGIIFKGSGWYVKDSKPDGDTGSKSSKSSSSSSSSDSSSSSESTASTTSESTTSQSSGEGKSADKPKSEAA